MFLTLSSTVGSDYNQPVVTTVTFRPDQTSASYSVPIVNDNVVESPEYFAALLSTTESNVNIGGGTAIVNILDDDCELFLQHIHTWKNIGVWGTYSLWWLFTYCKDFHASVCLSVWLKKQQAYIHVC